MPTQTNINNIIINFDAPSPAPINGYIVRYRKIGDVAYNTLSPNPIASPAIITRVDASFGYEGTIQCNCSNSIVSDQITFSTIPCAGDDKKIIGGFCQTGQRQNISSEPNGVDAGYICTYNYLFIDGSKSANFTEITLTPCI